MHPIIRSLLPVVETIATMFGKNCEVVLHDFSGPQHSIVKIENGYITGRKVGDPVTDLALSAWRKGGFDEGQVDKYINYKTKTKDGKVLKSSTVLIKDEKAKIVGCLCINYDLTAHLMFENLMSEFCFLSDMSEQKEETFVKDVDEILDNIISKAIREINKPVSLMQKEDNLRVVEIVDGKGAFMIKGAVDRLANQLDISRYSIYNYIEELKARKRHVKLEKNRHNNSTIVQTNVDM